MFGRISRRLAAGSHLYAICAPDPVKIVRAGSLLGKALKIIDNVQSAKKFIDIDSVEKAAKITTRSVVGKNVYKRINRAVTSSLKHSAICTMQPWHNKKNGIGGRSWIKKPVGNQRVIKTVRIVLHKATNDHLDIHIGHLSLVINISGKPVAKQLKFKIDGELTEQSKELLLNLVRGEINNRSRMVQNLDHSINNASSTWLTKDESPTGYGAGQTRQVVAEGDVEILSVGEGEGQSIKMYAPVIDSHNMLYIHKLYGGDSKKSPIVIFGSTNKTPKFEDRLHLKKTKDVDEFKSKVDKRSVRVKYDGASLHGNSNNRKTTVWSPRMNQNGGNIAYHIKLPEIYRIKSDEDVKFMGELLLKERFNPTILRHWLGDRYLTAAQIGGILNSHKIRPLDIVPEIILYRIDKWDCTNMTDLSFFKNLALQKKFSKNSEFLRVAKPASIKVSKNIEGLVGVPVGGNILDGYKIKFWGDPHDWEVTSVDLKFGPTGRTAGVICFRSLESGKRFKLGPGQLGSEADCLSYMHKGNELVGQVAKINSRQGHEGRAAQLVEWHLDKGKGPGSPPYQGI